MTTSSLTKAQLDFQPIPESERSTTARIQYVPARFYVNQFEEHAEAFEFLGELGRVRGLAPKTIVRALLSFRDDVVAPLANGHADDQRLQQLARGEFKPLDANTEGNTVQQMQLRLHVDKFVEHREAFDFISSQPKGERNKMVIRALLYYRDNIHRKLQQQRARAAKRRRS